MSIQAVIFDIGGVLLLETRIAQRQLGHASPQWAAHPIPAEPAPSL